MTKVLAINGSYRSGGITDKVLAVMENTLHGSGVEVEIIELREFPIEFCLNCRECTQQPGESPGQCVHDDRMHELIDKIESSDAFIFASPTNFGTVTALYKRFLERLTVYGYWPWGTDAPVERKAKNTTPMKKALLVSSCAAPGIMGRLLYDTGKQLKGTAKTIGAKSVGLMFTGLIAQQQYQSLPEGVQKKAHAMALRLLDTH